MRILKSVVVLSVLPLLATGCSNGASSAPTENQAFGGRCSVVTTAVAQMTMSLSTLPVPGAEFPTTEDEVRQRILDAGWSDEIQFAHDVSYADYDLADNQENFTESEKTLIADIDDLANRTASALFPMQDESVPDWNKRFEDWLTQILAARDKLSAACNK